MSPAHCYYDTTPAIETVIPLYYTNATAQIGRRDLVMIYLSLRQQVACAVLSMIGHGAQRKALHLLYSSRCKPGVATAGIPFLASQPAQS
jgi:hypothetical protein